jgi:hypothetical protein
MATQNFDKDRFREGVDECPRTFRILWLRDPKNR